MKLFKVMEFPYDWEPILERSVKQKSELPAPPPGPAPAAAPEAAPVAPKV